VVVLLILVVLAGLLVPQFSTLADDAHAVATRETLRQTRDAILSRYAADMRGVLVRDRDANPLTFDAVEQGAPGADDTPLLPATRALGPQLLFLFVNPHTYSTASTFDPLLGRGWRGPYVMSHGAVYPGHDPATAAARGFTSAYGEPGDATLLDAWGNPVVLIEGGTLALTEVRSAGADGILHTTDDLTLPLR
jgi:type II secretory pathway pseudopilin PulG